MSLLDEEYTDTSEEEEASDPNNQEPAFDPKDISIISEQNSLSTILSMMEDGLIITPEFQRREGLWNETNMSRLIESILLGIPIPAFYFDASESSNVEKWLVVDGLQRLSALKKFVIEKTLILKNLTLLTNLNNFSYDELDNFTKRKIARYQITTFLIRPNTPKEIRYDLFRRINTGGMRLTPQEIRNALNQGKPADLLKKLAENECFIKLFEINNQRMQDRELILRYVAFYTIDYMNYKKPFVSFLDKAMENIKNFDDNFLIEIENSFYQALFFIKVSGIEKNKKIPNKALFEALTALVGKINTEKFQALTKYKDNFVSELEAIKADKNSEFYKSIYEGTASKNSVITRFKTIEQLIEKHTKL